MKKLLFTSLFLFVGIFTASSLFGQVSAASLKFDKTSNSVAPGGTFQVQVVLDPGSEQVTSTDAWIVYDKNALTVVSVQDGSYFPTVLNDTSTLGKVYIAGLVNDPTEFKTGVGTVATITFSAVSAGTTNLSYECNPAATETSKIIKNDINSTNIIDCAANGQQSIVISSTGGGGGGGGTGGGGSTIPTTAPGTTIAPTVIPTLTLTPSPTIFEPSPTIATISATPSALPESGVLENMVNIALPGILLVIIGSTLKILLKI